jgi:hypothetical protein
LKVVRFISCTKPATSSQLYPMDTLSDQQCWCLAQERKARDKQQGQAGIIRVASGQDSDGILGVGHTHSKGYTYNQVCCIFSWLLQGAHYFSTASL